MPPNPDRTYKADYVREYLATMANPAQGSRPDYERWLKKNHGARSVKKMMVASSQFATIRRKYCESKSIDPETGANLSKKKTQTKKTNGVKKNGTMTLSREVAHQFVQTLSNDGLSVNTIAQRLGWEREEVLRLLRSADDHDTRFIAQCAAEDAAKNPQKVIDALTYENEYLRWRMEGQSKGFVPRLVRELSQEG